MNKIDEAATILRNLGLPVAQQNERSALCLLALLDMTPTTEWAQAASRLIGITPIMEWCLANYGKEWKPNTRETIRRQSMHQFVEAGIVLYNPDNPERPVNSPKAVYQIEPTTLALIRHFGTAEWEKQLSGFLAINGSLAEKNARPRNMALVPVRIPKGGGRITLSPGEHSILISAIIEEFATRFAPGSTLVYVGDTGDKWAAYFDSDLLESLGVVVDQHGKMPDVVLYDEQRHWLFLAEAVTSHGPVDSKRHKELSRLFSTSTAGLVFLTAFPDKATMVRYLPNIAWETEVWIATDPTHMIHFNGDKFLGPHSKDV